MESLFSQCCENHNPREQTTWAATLVTDGRQDITTDSNEILVWYD
jgi:hypothetical protein